MARRCIRNAKRGPVAIKVQGGYIAAWADGTAISPGGCSRVWAADYTAKVMQMRWPPGATRGTSAYMAENIPEMFRKHKTVAAAKRVASQNGPRWAGMVVPSAQTDVDPWTRTIRALRAEAKR